MKPNPNEAQNSKFSEYERTSMISSSTSELIKFENRTSIKVEILRFPGHCYQAWSFWLGSKNIYTQYET